MPAPDSYDERSVAALVEGHEAAVWADWIELAAKVPGNRLGAVVDRGGPVPMGALTETDSSSSNRVIGLGVVAPATPEDVDRIVKYYAGLGQRHFRVELAPVATPPDLAGWLERAGLHPAEQTMTKVWRSLEGIEGDLPGPDPGADDAAGTGRYEIRKLGAADADAVSALNLRAWGAWQATVSLRPWFAATVGEHGFTHYGAFTDDRLVCTGALAYDDQLAWIGFDATHPRYRSRQLRLALTLRRIADARSAGCRIIHAEGRTDRLTGHARMLDTLYVRRLFVPADASPEPGGAPDGIR